MGLLRFGYIFEKKSSLCNRSVFDAAFLYIFKISSIFREYFQTKHYSHY